MFSALKISECRNSKVKSTHIEQTRHLQHLDFVTIETKTMYGSYKIRYFIL